MFKKLFTKIKYIFTKNINPQVGLEQKLWANILMNTEPRTRLLPKKD